MKIDLGQKEEFVVSYAGSEYNIQAPTVRQAQALRVKLSESENEEVDVFIDLLDSLGMPKEVCDGMSPKQLIKLSEGILGNASDG